MMVLRLYNTHVPYLAIMQYRLTHIQYTPIALTMNQITGGVADASMSLKDSPTQRDFTTRSKHDQFYFGSFSRYAAFVVMLLSPS